MHNGNAPHQIEPDNRCRISWEKCRKAAEKRLTTETGSVTITAESSPEKVE